MTCDVSGGDFSWKSHDLSISISPNSFENVGQAELNINAYLSNSNQSFCGCHIVSAVFKIESNVKEFIPPVKLRIPHCVILESSNDCEKMHFLIQHADEYAIKKEGVFNVGEFYGTVELSRFSFVSIIWEQAVIFCRMIISFTPSNESNTSPQQQHEQQLQQSGDPSSSELESSSVGDNQSESKGIGDQFLANLAYGEILALPQCRLKQPDMWIGAYCIVKNLETWLQVLILVLQATYIDIQLYKAAY